MITSLTFDFYVIWSMGGDIYLSSVLTPDSVVRDLLWKGQGNHIVCKRSNSDSLRTGQAYHLLLYYFSPLLLFLCILFLASVQTAYKLVNMISQNYHRLISPTVHKAVHNATIIQNRIRTITCLIVCYSKNPKLGSTPHYTAATALQ